ncbi:hypothetical protein [uncultured Vibrio sp.]|uniref:hypothetical protein n=1 Tax=uncultured Vibrio sp. TaxID=114054 RepID=UPI0009131747|nr:hypothetical protein [uncultured Vibrio sp.]OIQ24446.1 MAG: hypothetical protein BM561_09770 [Vibrio sp. MedPE-SWchi]
MKKITLIFALLTSTSFAANAQLNMSFIDFNNKIKVTVTEDGNPVRNAQITSTMQGQSLNTTNENGVTYFYKRNTQGLHKFTATSDEGKTAKVSRFIDRNHR